MDAPNEQQSFPVVNHDDGIYSHPNELSYGGVHIVDQALEIIQAYRTLKYEEVKDLKKPPKSMKGIPDEILLKQIKDRAGRITCAASQLFCFSTREEHLDPQLSFYRHAEPVYPNEKSKLEHHSEHCWKVALLNTYRILDLQRDESVTFPYNWVPIQVNPNDIRYPTLLASAAYFMGTYYAKALALEKAQVAIKGEKMTNPNEGNFTPLGRVINTACREIELKHGELPRRGITKMLMSHLESQGRASTKNNPWTILAKQNEEEVTTKQLVAHIDRYRKRNLKQTKL